MKKILLFVLLSSLIIPFYSFAICVESTWECKDTIDYTDIPDDIIVKLLLDTWEIKATDEEVRKYGLEQIKAYYWAYNNWITSKESFKEADVEWGLTRIAMAKMLAFYAINQLWRQIAPKAVPEWPDMTNELNNQYNNWVRLAYWLWIMWIWIKEYRPFDTVTRAEFATALSRLLYWTQDGNPYYKPHLSKLKKSGLINQDNPKMLEKRGYVMLMLMRAANIRHDNTNKTYTEEDLDNIISRMNIKDDWTNRFYVREKDDLFDVELDTSNLTEVQKEVYDVYKMETNDSTRKAEILWIEKGKEIDKNSYKCYFCADEFPYAIPWEDAKNLYLDVWSRYFIPKKELPWYVPLNGIWIQAFDGFVWYSNWYLVSFPFKFPVDADTFVASEHDRRYKVQNNGLQYHHYIWNDKNYVYTREDYGHIVIKRIPKASDFKVLDKDEEWRYLYVKDSKLENVGHIFDNMYGELEKWEPVMWGYYPPVYKSWDYLFMTSWIWWEYYYWIWRFPVDIKTLKEESYKDPTPYSEYMDKYWVLSDKDYYYRIIESENWYKIFQRIKK